MKKIYSLNYLQSFSFIIFFFLIITNYYIDFGDISSVGLPQPISLSWPVTYSDQIQYLMIIESAPDFPDTEIHANQAQRFFFPYVIGIFLELLGLKEYIYIIFIFLNILLNLLIIHTFLKILNYLGATKNFSLIIISLLILNPYIFRVSLTAPLMINDYIFTYGYLLIAFYFLTKKINIFYIGLILCCLSRQTSLILNFIFLLIIIHKIFLKNNFKITTLSYGILINILIFFITKFIGSKFSVINLQLLIDTVGGILAFNYSVLELFLFFARMLIANMAIFILLTILVLNLSLYKKLFKFELLLIFLLAISLWSQPIMGGPSYTGGNVSRLTLLSFPVFLTFFIMIFKNLEIQLFDTKVIISLLLLSSLNHQTTRIFDYFFMYHVKHFTLITLFSYFAILLILLKNHKLIYFNGNKEY